MRDFRMQRVALFAPLALFSMPYWVAASTLKTDTVVSICEDDAPTWQQLDRLGRDPVADQRLLPAILQGFRAGCAFRAAKALDAIKPLRPDAIPQLLDGLRAPDAEDVAHHAIFDALVAIGPDGIPKMLPALDDADPHISSAACGALVAQGPPGITALIHRLPTASTVLRTNIARALWGRLMPLRMAHEALEQGADPVFISQDYRIADVEKERRFAIEFVVPALMRLLEDPEPDVEKATVDALGALGPDAGEAVPALLVATARDDTKYAASALDHIGSGMTPYVTDLARMLRSSDQSLRLEIVDLLGKALKEQAKPAVPDLVKLLDDPDSTVRIQVADALFAIDPVVARQAIPALREVMAQAKPGSSERLGVAQSISRIDPSEPSSIPVLMEFATGRGRDNDRYWGIEALHRMGYHGQDFQALLVQGLTDHESTIRRLSLESLADAGLPTKAVLSQILAGLHDQDTYVRGQAAETLGKLGPVSDEVIPALVASLHDENSEVVGKVIKALCQIGAPAIPALRARLDDRVALDALGQMQGPGLNVLIDALNNTDPKIRLYVVYEFGQLWQTKAPAAKALAARLDDPDSEVRRMVPSAFAHIGPNAADAIPDIVEFIQHHARPKTDEAQSAVFALSEIGPPSIPALVKLCSLPDPQARLHAIWSVGEFGPRAAEAIPVLTALLDDPEVRESAQEALDKVQGKKKPVSRLPENGR